MSTESLEQALRTLTTTGRLIKGRPYRQVWRFEFEGKAYYLKFFPHGGFRSRMRRLFRGSPAIREMQRLNLLQKAGVPSPRAVGTLLGFSIEAAKGDAIILEGIEPSVQLDRHLNQLAQRGARDPLHLSIVRQMIGILKKLAAAGLGHSDLHLGNFLLSDGKVFLVDGYDVHKGGLPLAEAQLLAVSADAYLTRADLMRAWKAIAPAGTALPAFNSRGPTVWGRMLARAFKNDRYFGHFSAGDWSGHFFRHAKFPPRWSSAARADVNEKDWIEAWPAVLAQIDADQFEIIKRSSSGDVLAGDIVLGGRPMSVIVKRPRRKFLYRYFADLFRAARARRTWRKSWQLVVRNLPTAWPLLLMEKRTAGYVTDAVIIHERIAGRPLSWEGWALLPRESLHALLRRVGRLLRKMEADGLWMYDAKADNWMVWEDPKLGLTPMVVDADSLRRRRGRGGVRRLLRSLRQIPGIGPAEERALLGGYAPFERFSENGEKKNEGERP